MMDDATIRLEALKLITELEANDILYDLNAKETFALAEEYASYIKYGIDGSAEAPKTVEPVQHNI